MLSWAWFEARSKRFTSLLALCSLLSGVSQEGACNRCHAATATVAGASCWDFGKAVVASRLGLISVGRSQLLRTVSANRVDLIYLNKNQPEPREVGGPSLICCSIINKNYAYKHAFARPAEPPMNEASQPEDLDVVLFGAVQPT